MSTSTPTALPTLQPTATAPAGPSAAERERLIRRVRLLSWASLAWMTVEGAVAIIAGLVAGSVALIGFGLDSVIEGFASVVIILLCAYLAGALLIGLLGNALVGAWWLDPIVGLLIAGVAVKEGLEAWRGEACCVASPIRGEPAAACEDDCCH